MAKTIGFIMLRHVNRLEINDYWKKSYEHIRRFYPENEIMIVDDNSNSTLDVEYQKTLYKTTVINSEHIGRGELLPYYYYLSNKLFDTAVIIHDSVFINSNIDFTVKTYKQLWSFEHRWDEPRDEIRIIKTLDNYKDVLDKYNNKKTWEGCFGGMSIITHDYLKQLDDKYNFSNLLPHIKTRPDRRCFERIIACLLQTNDCDTPECLLGDIHAYCKWGIKFKDWQVSKKLPVIKVWTGR